MNIEIEYSDESTQSFTDVHEASIHDSGALVLTLSDSGDAFVVAPGVWRFVAQEIPA